MKLSKIAYKSEDSLKQLINKFQIKIKRLEDLKPTFFDFEIEITDIQVNMINDKIRYYRKFYQDIVRFKIWKFENDCEDYPTIYHLEHTLEEIDTIKLQNLREKKIKRVIDEISDTDI